MASSHITVILAFRVFTSAVFFSIFCRSMRKLCGSLFTSSSKHQRLMHSPAKDKKTNRNVNQQSFLLLGFTPESNEFQRHDQVMWPTCRCISELSELFCYITQNRFCIIPVLDLCHHFQFSFSLKAQKINL